MDVETGGWEAMAPQPNMGIATNLVVNTCSNIIVFMHACKVVIELLSIIELLFVYQLGNTDTVVVSEYHNCHNTWHPSKKFLACL